MARVKSPLGFAYLHVLLSRTHEAGEVPVLLPRRRDTDLRVHIHQPKEFRHVMVLE